MILIYIYSLLLVAAILTWPFIREGKPEPGSKFISVIIVVRNEEDSIRALLNSLKNQSYNHFEIIIVDDQSDDHTVEIIKQSGINNLKLISLLPDERGLSPKKSGIEKAIRKSLGEIIFSTDGDCVLPPKVLETYAGHFENPKTHFLSGPVTFHKNAGLWNHLQTVEFASLIGTAAVAFYWKKPIMSSAANMAYRKDTFLVVDGYNGNKSLASGDDEFLMNKISREYPGGAVFVKDKNCIVETKPTKNLSEFYEQRKRWAGKWSSSINPVSIAVAVFIFLVNAVTLYFLFSGQWAVLMVRFISEAVFLLLVLWFLNRKLSILFIPLAQLIYPFYAVFFGLISLFPKKYQWKGRKLK